jgi:hypothetical protein
MLTGREIEIASMISEGLFEKEIADRLHVAFSTVHAHSKNIRRKINGANIADITRNYILTYDNTIRRRIGTAFRAGGILGFVKGRLNQAANQPERSLQAVRAQTGNEVAPDRKGQPKKAGKPDLLLKTRTNKTHRMNELMEKIERLMWLQCNCSTAELDHLINLVKEIKTEKEDENTERNR